MQYIHREGNDEENKTILTQYIASQVNVSKRDIKPSRPLCELEAFGVVQRHLQFLLHLQIVRRARQHQLIEAGVRDWQAFCAAGA